MRVWPFLSGGGEMATEDQTNWEDRLRGWDRVFTEMATKILQEMFDADGRIDEAEFRRRFEAVVKSDPEMHNAFIDVCLLRAVDEDIEKESGLLGAVQHTADDALRRAREDLVVAKWLSLIATGMRGEGKTVRETYSLEEVNKLFDQAVRLVEQEEKRKQGGRDG